VALAGASPTDAAAPAKPCFCCRRPFPGTPSWLPCSRRNTLAMVQRFVVKVLAFVFHPMNMIDFVAIAPFYADLVTPSSTGGSLAVLRVLRLARVLRLLRLGKHSALLQVMGRTMANSMDALVMLMFFIMLAMVLLGSAMFFCEMGEFDAATQTWVRPNLLGTGTEMSPFQSIPHSFWWTVVTMTTVGYGDYYPTTGAGKAVAGLVMLVGILTLALPITVIGSTFSEEYGKLKAARATRKEEEAAKSLSRAASLAPASPSESKASAAAALASVLSEAAPVDEPASPVAAAVTAVAAGGGPRVNAEEVAALRAEVRALRTDAAWMRGAIGELLARTGAQRHATAQAAVAATTVAASAAVTAAMGGATAAAQMGEGAPPPATGL
jgi:hypothetical protein